MGIPSYFAHFVRQHREIIKPVSKLQKPLNNLYLDCNGFIYEGALHFTSEELLIKSVCDKLIYYINLLKPNKKVFIAFDGVAPVAKLDQQRKRRYLSWFQSKVLLDFSNPDPLEATSPKPLWNTAAITPGTLFMDALALAIKKRFHNGKEFGLEEFIISGADEVGEGEHKIYDYIRREPAYHAKTTTVIYGLDADLIMLTLNHLHISQELYLFRETPEFIKSIDNTLNPKELYLLDIPAFGKRIAEDFTPMRGATSSTSAIKDYIFLFFLLGNDFLPHFPALNIRTQGIEILLNAYKAVLSTKNLSLIIEDKIVWKHLRLLIQHLAETELVHLKREYVLNGKRGQHNRKYTVPLKNALEDKVVSLPSTDRATELYINPAEPGWEARYYQTLFDSRIVTETAYTNTELKDICSNYLEGLEWTFKYYSTGCVDWRWTYKYHYPPLLGDLVRFIPYFDTALLSADRMNHTPVSPLVQLGYVLPKQNLYLLPRGLGAKLLQTRPDWYTDTCEFQWAFCKYFWEAHVKLPEIDIEELEKVLLQCMGLNVWA
jgi:5'-3' exoribonuclease 1